jgi:hypothetical protein
LQRLKKTGDDFPSVTRRNDASTRHKYLHGVSEAAGKVRPMILSTR